MNYRVIWQVSAIDDIEAIYDRSFDAASVIQAMRDADLKLRSDPNEAGESREPGTRVLFENPLVIWFNVNERFKEVMVFQVGCSR